MDIRIRHITRYSYGTPVTFGRHRLMLRPRDSFDLRIVHTGLTISPAATVTWMHDVYGNSVARASFSAPSDMLLVDSELVLRRFASTAPREAVEPWRGGAAVAYSENERIALAPFITAATDDADGALARFAMEAVAAGHGQTEREGKRHPLLDLSHVIHATVSYDLRFEEGTQAPLDTLSRARGSCRDFAWLFIEAARRLGYAARFVSGYLHNIAPEAGVVPLTASVGYSHAWAEVYVPGDGWIEFDPTNALVADRQLIRVAVTRIPAEASPVSGSFIGSPGPMQPEVSVTITPAEPD